jgi:hypothetical protein
MAEVRPHRVSMIPLGNGGVQLMWTTEAGELEVEIIAATELLVNYHDKESGKEEEWNAATEFSTIARLCRDC